MITTVTQKNMVTIPAEVGRKLGIKPGWRLDWQPVEGRDEILVRVIPDRGERARRLLGDSHAVLRRAGVSKRRVRVDGARRRRHHQQRQHGEQGYASPHGANLSGAGTAPARSAADA